MHRPSSPRRPAAHPASTNSTSPTSLTSPTFLPSPLSQRGLGREGRVGGGVLGASGTTVLHRLASDTAPLGELDCGRPEATLRVALADGAGERQAGAPHVPLRPPARGLEDRDQGRLFDVDCAHAQATPPWQQNDGAHTAGEVSEPGPQPTFPPIAPRHPTLPDAPRCAYSTASAASRPHRPQRSSATKWGLKIKVEPEVGPDAAGRGVEGADGVGSGGLREEEEEEEAEEEEEEEDEAKSYEPSPGRQQMANGGGGGRIGVGEGAGAGGMAPRGGDMLSPGMSPGMSPARPRGGSTNGHTPTERGVSSNGSTSSNGSAKKPSMFSSFAASVSALAPGALGSGGGASGRPGGANASPATNNSRGGGGGPGGAGAGQSNGAPKKQSTSPGPSLASRIDQKLANLNLDEY